MIIPHDKIETIQAGKPETILSEQEMRFKEDLGMKFLVKLNETLDLNAKDKNRLAEENTYKSSHLYITINFGIIAAGSFVFTSKTELTLGSKILSIFLICSVISIIFEVIYRKKVLKANIQLCDKRLVSIETIQKRFMQALPDNLKKPFMEYGKIVNTFNEEYQNKLDEIDEKRKKFDQEVSQLRKWSSFLLIISIFSLTLVLICESGLPTLIGRLIENLKNFSP